MRHFCFSLSILLLFSGCKKDPSLWKINNLNNNTIFVFGHGGSGTKYHYPMNSLRSLNDVLDLGVNGTEMDIELSKDHVLVLYHNVKLQDGTACDGKISEKNWDDIKGCHYKLPLLSPASLIKADDFFAQRPDLNKHIFTFDTKVSVDDEEVYQQHFADALYSLIQNYKLEETCFIESYSIPFLKLLQTKNTQLKLFLHADDYATCLKATEQVKLYGITMDRTRISTAEIADAHKHNLRVTLFNLETEKANLDGIKMNPDFMQSDKCDYLINALN